MDKYDEMAEKLNQKILAVRREREGGYDWGGPGVVALIGAFGRRAAAEEARRMVQCAVDAVAQGAKMAEVIAVLHLEAAALDKSEGGV